MLGCSVMVPASRTALGWVSGRTCTLSGGDGGPPGGKDRGVGVNGDRDGEMHMGLVGK